MHDKMMKMLMGKKKEGKILSDSEKKSKLQALTGMRDMASGMMGEKLKGLKKVMVASNSKPGLQEGLHKAEDLINQGSDEEQKPEDGYSEGGDVYDRGDKGGHIAKMPEGFDTDLDQVNKEHDLDQRPRDFNEGGMIEESPEEEASESPEYESGEHEGSIEKIVEDCPPEELDELIKKLEEKKQSLQK